MTSELREVDLRRLSGAGALLRPLAPAFSRRCAMTSVDVPHRPVAERRSLRHERIGQSIEQLVSDLCNELDSHRPHRRLLGRLGARMAESVLHGDDPEQMLAPLRYAQAAGPALVEMVLRRHGWSNAAVAEVRFAIEKFIETAAEHIAAGHQAGLEQLRRCPGDAMQRLTHALVNGSWDDRCDRITQSLDHELPREFMVVAVPENCRDQLPLGALTHWRLVTGDDLLIICDALSCEWVLSALEETDTPFASFSIVKHRDQVPGAATEARRLTDLARRGVAGSTRERWLDCREYMQLLWLANAPTRWEEELTKLLAPLADYSGQYRERLLSTLRLYLTTRESAPGLATALGAHPQTVRQHLKILNSLLGDVLIDPDRSMMLLLLLNSKELVETR